MAGRDVLAFAAASGRIGSVFLQGDKLLDWQISKKASKNGFEAASYARSLFKRLSPDLIITEDPIAATHKGEKTRLLLIAIAEEAERVGLEVVTVPRQQQYANKYAEAEALTSDYPELAPWKPDKRRFFDNEPRNTVIFEALSLALAARKLQGFESLER